MATNYYKLYDHNNKCVLVYKEKFKHVWKLTLKSFEIFNGDFHGISD